MTKFSEILIWAAEKAFMGSLIPITYAKIHFNAFSFPTNSYVLDSGYFQAKTPEETCMTLCLAAAIAESEGD